MNQDGFAFEYPWILLFLIALPIIAGVHWFFRNRRAATMLFSRTSLFQHLNTGWRVMLRRLLPVLQMAALALMIVAAARPCIRTYEEATVEGIDIYVTLDLSGSMQGVDVSDEEFNRSIARGINPPNRFDSAKNVLTDFVTSRRVDRIGMVVFAKDAFLQFPLTLDYSTVLTQLENLELEDIDGNGTAIGNALGRAVAGLKDSEARSKIVILITDGDRRGGNISPMQAAEFAKDLNVNVFPILVGKEGRTRVPVAKNPFTGALQYQFREYPVNPKLLEDIAQKTGGKFYKASDQEALRKNLHDILDTYEKTRLQDISDVSRRELGGPFVGLAFFLLLLELVLRFGVVRPFP